MGTVLFLLFPYCCSLYTEFCAYFSNVNNVVFVMFSWLCFQMNMNDYPHVTIAKDGRWCSMGQHGSGFPRVLYDALLDLGYIADVSVYRARMSMAHSMEKCEVSVTMPLNLIEPWMTSVISVELDDTVKHMAQVTLTSMCGSRLADTAAMPITFFPVCYQRTPCGSSALRPYLTPRVPTSM
jgi:hypothetical protein